MRALYFSLLILMLALSACGTVSNRYSAEKLDVSDTNADQGIIILSTGAAKRCISTATFLSLKSNGSGEIALFNVDGYAVKSDFTEHQGSLHTLILPEGEYFLSPWIANPYVVSKSKPVFKFQLNSGEILYLGEYYMPVACKFNNVSVFRDQYGRDMSLLKTKNPALVTDKVIKRMPEFVGIL